MTKEEEISELVIKERTWYKLFIDIVNEIDSKKLDSDQVTILPSIVNKMLQLRSQIECIRKDD